MREKHVAVIIQHHLAQSGQILRAPINAFLGGNCSTEDQLEAWYDGISKAMETGAPIQFAGEKGRIILGVSHDVSVRVITWSDFEAQQKEAREEAERQQRQAELGGVTPGVAVPMPGVPPGTRVLLPTRKKQ